MHGDRSFDWNDFDFLLFGVTTEEIHWLQSGIDVLVSHLLHRGDAGTFVSGRNANVVRETVIAASSLVRRRGSLACAHIILWTCVDPPAKEG